MDHVSSVAEPSSGVKINGSHTRLLYWCHGVDGRFVSLDTRGGALTCCKLCCSVAHKKIQGSKLKLFLQHLTNVKELAAK